MLDQEKAKSFFEGRKIAVVGVSSKGKGFGTAVFKHLFERQYNVFAVNLNGGMISNQNIYRSLADIQSGVDTVVTVVKPNETDKVVRQAVELGIKNVWMQFGSTSEEAVKFCEENNVNVISNQCVIMFTNPTGLIHRFHKWIWRTTGQIS